MVWSALLSTSTPVMSSCRSAVNAISLVPLRKLVSTCAPGVVPIVGIHLLAEATVMVVMAEPSLAMVTVPTSGT